MVDLDSAQRLECLRPQAWEDDGGPAHASADASDTGASGPFVSARVTRVAAKVSVALLEAAEHPACRGPQRSGLTRVPVLDPFRGWADGGDIGDIGDVGTMRR
jgi:hypothetical protein